MYKTKKQTHYNSKQINTSQSKQKWNKNDNNKKNTNIHVTRNLQHDLKSKHNKIYQNNKLKMIIQHNLRIHNLQFNKRNKTQQTQQAQQAQQTDSQPKQQQTNHNQRTLVNPKKQVKSVLVKCLPVFTREKEMKNRQKYNNKKTPFLAQG